MAAGTVTLRTRTQSGATTKGSRLTHEELDDNFLFLQSGTGAIVRTAQSKLRDVVSVKDFGAVGDGVVDDTSAIQTAIRVLGDGDALFLPEGSYKISATLSISNLERCHFYGTGELQPTTAVSGVPVVEFVNCRDSLLEDWTISGNASGAPAAGIRFRRASSGGYAPTSMRLKNVRVGSTAANSVVDGIDFTSDTDSNNAESILEDVKIRNFSGAGIHIEHSNSVNHHVINPNISGGPTAIETDGGTFNLYGGALNVTDWDFDIGGAQINGITINNIHSESASKMIRVASTSLPHVAIFGYTKKGSTATTTVIDVSSVNAVFSMTGCNQDLGQAGQTFSFSDAGSQVKFTGCHLGVTTFSWAGLLALVGNTYSAGTVTYTPGASAELRQFGDQGGGAGDVGFRLGQAGRTGGIVREHLTATFAPNFPDTATGATSDLTVTVTGAADGDVVTLGIEAAAFPAAGAGTAAGYFGFVSAPDTVTVRFWNASGGNINPAQVTIRVDVWKH